jgi:uncharacterized membrane protein
VQNVSRLDPRPLGGVVARAVRTAAGRLRDRALAMTRWQWALLVVLGLYVWRLTAMSLEAHHGLGTSAFDFALYDQGVWLLSRFEAPFVTLMGRNLFGDHASFVLVFLVPLYWVAPGAGTLFLSQSLAIAAGAIPIFLYARRRLGNEGVALLLAVVYLLHPAVSWTNMEQFHPDAFLGVFVGFAIYGALTERWRLYTVFVLLTLLVKEDALLVIVPLGVWVAFRRDAFIGVMTAVWAIGYGFFATVLLMQLLSGYATLNMWRIPFGGPTGLLRTAITDPGLLFDHLRADGRPWYVVQMTAPFAWVFTRLPEIAAIGTLVLVSNTVSVFWYQHSVRFHYSLVLVAPLALGTVHAIGAFSRRRTLVVAVVGVAALWSSYLWSTLPMAREARQYFPASRPFAVAAHDLVALVPDDAVVSVDHVVAPHLARRRQIYMFPNPFRTTLYGVPGRPGPGARLPEADEVEYVLLRAGLRPGEYTDTWLEVADEFVLLEGNTYWELYRRP